MRAPVGSKSGSARTSAGTTSPNTSTVRRVPGVATAASTQATVVPFDVWWALRVCESGDNWFINTGNGYYGAYQFDARTWHGLGYSGLPSEASKTTQDWGALRLYIARGWQPWPSCSAKLGL